MDCICEADVIDSHYEIDGIEVFFAGKTSGQVGLFMKGRIHTVTQGAGKPGRPLTGSGFVTDAGDRRVCGGMSFLFFRRELPLI